MKSEVEPVRRTGVLWMLLAAGAVGGVTGALTTAMMTRSSPDAVAAVPCKMRPAPIAPPQPRVVDNLDSTGLRANLSQRTRMFDVMSADSFAPDGNTDEIYELEIDAEQAIRNIFVIHDAEGLQWDTVIGSDQITYKQRFSGHQGRETWHLGVRENGAWKNAPDGQIRGLGAGHHLLELVATSPQSWGPRIIAVQFVDGTVREIALR